MEKYYIIKSSTFIGVWARRNYFSFNYYDYTIKTRNIYAERYIAVGKKSDIIQMNGMRYNKEKLLIFKNKEDAELACEVINKMVKKCEVENEYGKLILLNDYKVIEYKPRIKISNLKSNELFEGAYTRD